MIENTGKNKKKKYWVKSEYEIGFVTLFLSFSPLTILFTYNHGIMFECNRLVIVICFDIAILIFLILRIKYYEFYEDLFVIKRLRLGKSKIVYYKNITDCQWHVGFAATPDILIIYHLENTKRIKEELKIRHKKEASLIKNKLIEQGYNNIRFENL